MDANLYQSKALRTKPVLTNGESLMNAALGLTGEAGEVADLVKKHMFQGHELSADALIDELGDVLWYAAFMADSLGVSLSDVMRRNIAKLEIRYPDGFDPDRSKNRD